MQAFLIDPTRQAIEVVDWDEELPSLYALLNCSTFEVVYLNDDTGDALYIDEEGRLVDPNPDGYFMITDRPDIVCGKALVVGTNFRTGDSTPPKRSLDAVKAAVRFVEAPREEQDMDPYVIVTEWPKGEGFPL